MGSPSGLSRDGLESLPVQYCMENMESKRMTSYENFRASVSDVYYTGVKSEETI